MSTTSTARTCSPPGPGSSPSCTALLCYTAVNTCLVVGAVVLSAPERTFRQVLGRGDEVVLELATLSMGALAAGAISSTSPLHALLVLPPLVVLHRAVLVRHFEQGGEHRRRRPACSTPPPGRTGPSGCCAARSGQGPLPVCSSSTSTTSRSSTTRHGHLAGDEVLAAVAAALRAEVRDDDLVGRFGGEEFVILLPGHDGAGYGPAGAGGGGRPDPAPGRRARCGVATPDGPLTVGDLSVSVGGATLPGRRRGSRRAARGRRLGPLRREAGGPQRRPDGAAPALRRPAAVAAVGGGRRPFGSAPPVARRGHAPVPAGDLNKKCVVGRFRVV